MNTVLNLFKTWDMQTFIFGESVSQQPILGYRFGRVGPRILVLGGVHGDEVEGVVAAYGLIKTFVNRPDLATLSMQLTIVRRLNSYSACTLGNPL